MKRKILALAAILILLVACSNPVYDDRLPLADTTIDSQSQYEPPFTEIKKEKPIYEKPKMADKMTRDELPLLVNSDNVLASNYQPENLVKIKGSVFKLEKNCAEALGLLQAAAGKDGIFLPLLSAYRTYDYQKNLFQRRVNLLRKIHGDNAEKVAATSVAPEGTSEHQTGLAADVGDVNRNFAGKKGAIWLENHAHEYGFIVRYAKDKQDITGIIHEPWHIRYVGIEFATDIKQSGLCLEEYIAMKTGEKLEDAS